MPHRGHAHREPQLFAGTEAVAALKAADERPIFVGLADEVAAKAARTHFEEPHIYPPFPAGIAFGRLLFYCSPSVFVTFCVTVLVGFPKL